MVVSKEMSHFPKIIMYSMFPNVMASARGLLVDLVKNLLAAQPYDMLSWEISYQRNILGNIV